MKNQTGQIGRKIVFWLVVALLLLGISVGAFARDVAEAILARDLALSPDGAKLAYVLPDYDKLGDQVSEIWVADLNGSHKQKIAAPSGQYNILWGQGCLVASGSRNVLVFPFPSLGSGRTIILPEAYYVGYLTPSPDGKWAVFSGAAKAEKYSGLFTLNIATGKIKPLAEDLVKSHVGWSPDATKIAYGAGDYQKDFALKIVDIASGEVTATGANGTGPNWSPDGKWIVYIGDAKGGGWLAGVPTNGSLLKINVETKTIVKLTDSELNKDDAATGNYNLRGDLSPVWSPDGTRIAYQYLHEWGNEQSGESSSEGQIWVIAADGSHPQKISDNSGALVWAKDGKSVFVKGDNGITRVVPDTGEKTPVITWQPALAPKPKESDWKTIKAPGAEVKYLWITPEYAKALLKLAAEARNIYAETFHCDMPAKIYLTITKDPEADVRLFTDGESQVFLTINSLEKLAPPQRSGVRNIYGICHELGHIAMYRRIKMIGLPEGIGEGWAHYAGSVVIDEVYKKYGPKLWPIPYDYRADGLQGLQQQVAAPGALSDPVLKASAAFYQAHERYGAATVFAAMNTASADRPYGKDLMPRFVEALAKLTGDPSSRELFPAELVTAKTVWQVANRKINDQTCEGLKTTPDAGGVLLQYDEGKSDNQVSYAGSGHGIIFQAPTGKWAVDGVSFYGDRYGEKKPPKKNFSIFICDPEFNIIKEIDEPYDKLALESPQWHTFTFSPVAVPRGFYICIYFDATAMDGFYMHYYKPTVRSHSKIALPWTFVNDYENDWLIRAHLRRLEE